MCFLKHRNDGCQLVVEVNLKSESVSQFDTVCISETDLFAIHCAIVMLDIYGCADLSFVSFMPELAFDKGWERDNDDGGIGIFHPFYLQHQCSEACFILQRQGISLLE